MKTSKKFFRVISLCFKGLDDVFTSIISTVLNIIITVAVLGGLAIAIVFVYKTLSTLLAGI